jgi:hypothetical protein
LLTGVIEQRAEAEAAAGRLTFPTDEKSDTMSESRGLTRLTDHRQQHMRARIARNLDNL